MAIIRVNPEILKTNVLSINSTAGETQKTGSFAQAASLSAPSYDGQFGPKVKAIGSEAMMKASSLSNEHNKLATRLDLIARGFESADGRSIHESGSFLVNSRLPPNGKPSLFYFISLLPNRVLTIKDFYDFLRPWLLIGGLFPSFNSVPILVTGTILSPFLGYVWGRFFGIIINWMDSNKGNLGGKTDNTSQTKQQIQQETVQTSGDLRTILGATEDGKKSKVVHDSIENNHSKESENILKHGMTDSEKMNSINYEGITIRYVDNKDENSAITKTIKNLADSDKLPDELQKHTREIILTDQKNKDDSYWAKQYKMPGFESAATGGDGDIVVYGGRQASVDTISHEMGHNLAKARYGSATPTSESEFDAAISSGEPPPTKYAKVAPAEDFAESIKLYIADPEHLQKIAPTRYDIINKLLKDESYGG